MITSTKNKQVKSWRKLSQNKERKRTGLYLIEGEHLLAEAIKHARDQIVQIIVREDRKIILDQTTTFDQIPYDLVTTEIAAAISDTPSNQGIFAVMKQSVPHRPTEVTGAYLWLERLQDPGNVGTLIRSADACGFSAVVLGEGTVDLYNPKVIRAAQGSHWHLPVYQDQLFDWALHFRKRGIPIYGSATEERAVNYKDISAQRDFALIVGNEGQGMSENLMKQCHQILSIPIQGHAESLNAAIAGSILMFHIYDSSSG